MRLPDSLEDVDLIGPKRAQILRNNGINNVDELSRMDSNDIESLFHGRISKKQVEQILISANSISLKNNGRMSKFKLIRYSALKWIFALFVLIITTLTFFSNVSGGYQAVDGGIKSLLNSSFENFIVFYGPQPAGYARHDDRNALIPDKNRDQSFQIGLRGVESDVTCIQIPFSIYPHQENDDVNIDITFNVIYKNFDKKQSNSKIAINCDTKYYSMAGEFNSKIIRSYEYNESSIFVKYNIENIPSNKFTSLNFSIPIMWGAGEIGSKFEADKYIEMIPVVFFNHKRIYENKIRIYVAEFCDMPQLLESAMRNSGELVTRKIEKLNYIDYWKMRISSYSTYMNFFPWLEKRVANINPLRFEFLSSLYERAGFTETRAPYYIPTEDSVRHSFDIAPDKYSVNKSSKDASAKTIRAQAILENINNYNDRNFNCN